MGNKNSGRRPQPTALKILRGNPGQRKLNRREPVPPEGEVVKPPELSGRAGLVWDRLAPLALAMRTLTTADTEAFAVMCELRATMLMASSQKDAEGFSPFTVSEDYNGADKVGTHAALKLERDSASALRPYLALFGLEPVSRARIAVPKKAEPEAPVSKWQGILK